MSETMQCLHPSTQETPEIDSKGQLTTVARFARALGYGCSVLANFSMWHVCASKNPIFLKSRSK
jgi:hypothetical protein